MNLTKRDCLPAYVLAFGVTILLVVIFCLSAFPAQNSTIPAKIMLDPATRIPHVVLSDGRQFRLLSDAEVAEGRKLADRVAAMPGQVAARQKLKHGKPPATFDLMKYQTPIRNQGARGSCTYFSTTAAMEAAYKRAGHGDLDLSEQFMVWLRDSTMLANADDPKAQSQTKPGKRESQLGSLIGGGSSYNLFLMTKYGLCSETDDPYISDPAYDDYTSSYYTGFPLAKYDWSDQSFPQAPINNWNYASAQFPEAARDGAHFGINDFVSLTPTEFQDSATIESILGGGHEVIVDLDLRYDMSDPTKPVWVYKKGDAEHGGHSILLIGYDHKRHFFIVKNSWGPTSYDASTLAAGWKDIVKYDGYTLVDYDYLQMAYSGGYITDVPKPGTDKYNWQRALGEWDLRIFNKTTKADVSKGTLVWRHLPGSSEDLPSPDRRLGDYTDSKGKQFRVNAEIRHTPAQNITLYIDFAHPAQGYGEAKGDQLLGTLLTPETGKCSIVDGKVMASGGGTTGKLFGVAYSDLSFEVTHK